MGREMLMTMLMGCAEEAESRTFAQSVADDQCEEMMDLLCGSCEEAGVYSLESCLAEVECEAVKRTNGDPEDCITDLQTWDCATGMLPFDCYGVLSYTR